MAVPFNDRLWFDDEQSRAPILPEAGERSPEQSVLRLLPGQFGRPVEDSELLSQGEVFSRQFEVRCEEGAKKGRQSREECHDPVKTMKRSE